MPCTVNAIYRNRHNPLPFTICEVWGQTGDEATANARLIAAAPDMLAALEGAEQAMQDALDGGEYWQENFAKADLPAIRAAIARARNT